MKPKVYPVLCQAIEEGIKVGYRHAFKYEDNPLEDLIIEAIRHAVLTSILDYFDLEDGE